MGFHWFNFRHKLVPDKNVFILFFSLLSLFLSFSLSLFLSFSLFLSLIFFLFSSLVTIVSWRASLLPRLSVSLFFPFLFLSFSFLFLSPVLVLSSPFLLSLLLSLLSLSSLSSLSSLPPLLFLSSHPNITFINRDKITVKNWEKKNTRGVWIKRYSSSPFFLCSGGSSLSSGVSSCFEV